MHSEAEVCWWSPCPDGCLTIQKKEPPTASGIRTTHTSRWYLQVGKLNTAPPTAPRLWPTFQLPWQPCCTFKCQTAVSVPRLLRYWINKDLTTYHQFWTAIFYDSIDILDSYINFIKLVFLLVKLRDIESLWQKKQ